MYTCICLTYCIQNELGEFATLITHVEGIEIQVCRQEVKFCICSYSVILLCLNRLHKMFSYIIKNKPRQM